MRNIALELSELAENASRGQRDNLEYDRELFVRETDRLENQLKNVSKVIESDHHEWVPEVKADEARIKVTPVFPENLAPPLLEAIAPVRVYMSRRSPVSIIRRLGLVLTATSEYAALDMPLVASLKNTYRASR